MLGSGLAFFAARVGIEGKRSLKFYGITAGVLLLGVVLSLMTAPIAVAQNVFRVRIDTVTAKAGDTVTVNVYYSFTSTHSHALNGYVARFSYNTNLVWIAGYITDSTTASDGFPVSVSHLGIATSQQGQEINLAKPVLFRMRVVLRSALADTGWIHWDPDFAMFDSKAEVDSIVQQDGWVRTATASGHTVLTTPAVEIAGRSNGYVPDSVRFDLPVIISDIRDANVRSARLSFVFDSSRLRFDSATSKSGTATISSMGRTGDTASIVFTGSSQGLILGGDTLVQLHFVALVGIDTECLTLSDPVWQPLNSDALIGIASFAFDSICLLGSYGVEGVDGDPALRTMQMYPNPARDFVVIGGFEAARLQVFDELGRCVWTEGNLADGIWRIPATLWDGVYTIIARGTHGAEARAMIVIKR